MLLCVEMRVKSTVLYHYFCLAVAIVVILFKQNQTRQPYVTAGIRNGAANFVPTDVLDVTLAIFRNNLLSICLLVFCEHLKCHIPILCVSPIS